MLNLITPLSIQIQIYNNLPEIESTTMSQVLSTLSGGAAVGAGGVKLNRLMMGSSAAALLYWAYLSMKRRQRKRPSVIFMDQQSKQSNRNKKKADLGKTLKQLRIIMGTIMGFKEVMLALGMTLGLILRTICDMWQIYNGTEIESAIITANVEKLKYTLVSFFISMPTFAFVNNIIRYFADKLRLNLRYNLSKILYDKYMTELTFYQLSSATGDQTEKFQNVDQLLTSDIDKFCGSVVELYNNMSKPLLDITILVHKMTTSYTGGATPSIMIAWLACVGAILTGARRTQTGYIIDETQCEGQLRFVHSRLIQNSEEVAFFRGNNKEKDTLMHALENLNDALEAHTLFKFKINFLDNVVGRYMSTLVGYLALALPFLSNRYLLHTNEDRLEYYYKSGRMMMKLAESIHRIILAGQGLSKMAAYTERVRSLMITVDSFNKLSNVTTTNNINNKLDNKSSCDPPNGLNSLTNNISTSGGIVELCDPDEPMIEFKNVTLSTPNGDILLRDLTFTIRRGQNVIISGPNGSGKSSLFRVLGNLWRIQSGKLIRPTTKELFYICQKPYMTLGTFRDQIIYPDRQDDMIKKLRKDSHLVEILKIVELQYLLERGEHRMDSISDWQEVLSGGEKQRMALARLIYHRPQFAILDECTSAVAIDVEQKIYAYLSEQLQCTLLSVTHRVKQLAKFHHFVLNFDGNGDYEFKHLIATLDEETN